MKVWKHAELLHVALFAAVGAWLLYCATRAAGPLPAYGTQPPAAEGRDDPEPSGVCLAAHEHLQGVRFLEHRYPERIGMQLTSVMHHGFSGIRVPVSDQSRWITSPPSEAMW